MNRTLTRLLAAALLSLATGWGAQQTINIGTVANDGTGDPARTAFGKVNSNFTELYGRTLTMLGTTGEVTLSAGAQTLGADRTWTVSLPSALTFTGKTITGGTFASPTLTTPVLGVATATSINGLTITSSTGTLTIPNGITLNAGAGGTLGTAAFTAATAYQAANATLAAIAANSGAVDISGTTLTIGPLGTPLAVTSGGSGRATGTTAYGLIAAGTTATGAQQTLSAGATTDILVGGGASALPSWTTATGSGAPVRATSPTLVTPVLGNVAAGSVLTNATGLPISTGVSGLGSSVATALAVATNTAGGFSPIDGTATLTNKRITPRITSISSSATPTVNTDNCDCVTITALAAAITSMTTNLTGTPSNFDQLEFRILDNGTARAITWGASFASGTGTLPTTTTLGKALCVYLEYDSVQAKWMCQSAGSYP